MNLLVLGATGTVGSHVTTRAVELGHRVTAAAHDPVRLAEGRLAAATVVRVDVADHKTIRAALAGVDVVISTLGVRPGENAAISVDAARNLADEHVPTVWLGSFGLGTTRKAAGPIFGPLARWVFRKEAKQKILADEIFLAAGASVVHSPPFNNKAGRRPYELVEASTLRPRLAPSSISRVTLASLLLGEAENRHFAGQVAVAAPA